MKHGNMFLSEEIRTAVSAGIYPALRQSFLIHALTKPSKMVKIACMDSMAEKPRSAYRSDRLTDGGD